MFLGMKRIWKPVYEGEGEGGTGETPPTKTFTQDDVNKLLADEKRKHQESSKKTLEELEALKKRSNMTAEERKAFEERVETLKKEIYTKEELAQQEVSKLNKKHEAELTDLKAKHDTLWSRYQDETIVRSITDAAVAKDQEAINPSHIVAILRPNTHLVETKDDDGNATGNYEIRVTFRTTNKDGKVVDLELTPAEAVKRMSEMDEHSALFKSSARGGINGTNRGGKGAETDIAELAKDPAAYMKARKDGKIKF